MSNDASENTMSGNVHLKKQTKRTSTCTKHVGVKVLFDPSKYDECPLCVALDKIADYETMD